MKALPKRKGNIGRTLTLLQHLRLNESPSQKEGKFFHWSADGPLTLSLNESPSQKEGKWVFSSPSLHYIFCLNESPSQKEGKLRKTVAVPEVHIASMKALPKRKGNSRASDDRYL